MCVCLCVCETMIIKEKEATYFRGSGGSVRSGGDDVNTESISEV